MAREADIPEQTDAPDGGSDEFSNPPERSPLYPDIPKVSSNDLLGEVIDVLGFYGPFKSAFAGQDGKDKHYIIFRFRAHSPIAYTNTDGTKSRLKCGDEAQSTTTSVRIRERIAGKAEANSESGEGRARVRGLIQEIKTEQGYKIRTLAAAPSTWECETCGAKAPAK